MSTLIKHELVTKEKNPAQYSLTEKGKKLAKELYNNKYVINKFKKNVFFF